MRGKGTIALLLLSMALFGLGVRSALGLLRTDTQPLAATPAQQKPAVELPGTLYVAQEGALYRLRGGNFSRFTTDQRGWTQPAVLPDGRVLAVSRQGDYSDLVILGSNGAVAEQLTHDAATGRNPGIDANHWTFYPTLAPDGTTLFYSYDSPKNGYMVDLATWSRPLQGNAAPRRWSNPNPYTGGDVMPVPLRSGGVIDVSYAVDSKNRITSRVELIARPGATAVPLTSADADCLWPTLSPDQLTLAMVCTDAQQHANLVTASFDGATLGPLRVLVNDRLVSAPAWSPDGTGLAYLAPSSTGGAFQLWWLEGVTSASKAPHPPVQVTTGVGLDAGSRPAWTASTQ
jgi:Tol biopolymer transport system component